MKNKLIAVIAAVLCLIPTAVAFASYRNTLNAPVDVSNAEAISVVDLTGKEFSFTKEADGKTAEELIRYFLDMKERAQPISTLPESLNGEQFFKVTISAAVKTLPFECYFSTNPATCYFVADDGTPYKIGEEDAAEFIQTKYAECLYKEAAMPILTLSGSAEVTPDQATWRYKNYTGGYVDSDSIAAYQNDESYDIEGGLDLSFDLNPDFCSVLVKDTADSVLFDGMNENLSEFTIDKTRQIIVEVTAKWYEDPSRSFYGELFYRFTTVVTAPAEFYKGMDSVNAGKFVAITALNVTKPSAITMTTDMPGAIAPVFYSETSTIAVGLLPIDVETPTGDYTLTFAYGGTIAHVMLHVENVGFGTSYYSVPDSVLATARSQSALLQFEGAMKEIMATGENGRYFSGYFLKGVTDDAQLLRGFGRPIHVNGSESPTYRNNGVDYAAEPGQPVVACNSGKVVYVGELDYTGKIIVIEHGFGLKTWYYNLGGTSVSVGDSVEKGQGIGATGQTGFTGQSGAHIAMSVGSTFVSPYDTWADSPVAGKVLIAKIDE